MNMKICNKCLCSKPLKEFSWKSKEKGKKQSSCKECWKKIHQGWYQNNREELIQRAIARKERVKSDSRKEMLKFLEGKSCEDCEESDLATLDFDHDGNKCYNVSKMISQGYKWSTILEEIKKCTIRCANCHRKKTALEQGWYDKW